MGMRFARPNTTAEVARFENANGIILPASYTAFMTTTGGGSPEPDCLVDDSGEAVIFVARIFPLHEERMNDQTFAFPSPTESGFLVIGTDGGGDYLLLELESGAVFYWDHESDSLFPNGTEMLKVADSIGGLVRALDFPVGESPEELGEIEALGATGDLDQLEAFLTTNGVDSRNLACRTVAEEAARYGNSVVLRRCLEVGAPITGLLHYAAAGRDLQTVELLIASGSDINEPNSKGESPLDQALTKEVYQRLESHGARHLKRAKPPHLR